VGNTYYRQEWAGFDESIELTATDARQFRENDVVLTLSGWNSDTQRVERISLCLSEKEQDELIMGFLERRGISLSWIQKGQVVSLDRFGQGISSSGTEQSKIHPANKEP